MDDRYITQAEGARRLGVTRAYLQNQLKSANPPTFFERRGNAWRIDTQDPTWEQRVTTSGKSPMTEDDIADLKVELQRLKAGSMKAGLEIPIQKAELNRYKIEQEKLALKKSCFDLIEYELCAFLFTGYMDKINREILDAPKKLGKKLELCYHDAVQTKLPASEFTKKIQKIISSELEDAIRAVVAEQKKDVAEWRSDNE